MVCDLPANSEFILPIVSDSYKIVKQTTIDKIVIGGKIMDINIDFGHTEEINSQSHGGQYWDGDYHHDDFGICINELSISGLTGKDFSKLAVEMVNHLITNGYRYKLENNKFVEVE